MWPSFSPFSSLDDNQTMTRRMRTISRILMELQFSGLNIIALHSSLRIIVTDWSQFPSARALHSHSSQPFASAAPVFGNDYLGKSSRFHSRTCSNSSRYNVQLLSQWNGKGHRYKLCLFKFECHSSEIAATD